MFRVRHWLNIERIRICTVTKNDNDKNRVGSISGIKFYPIDLMQENNKFVIFFLDIIQAERTIPYFCENPPHGKVPRREFQERINEI